MSTLVRWAAFVVPPLLAVTVLAVGLWGVHAG